MFSLESKKDSRLSWIVVISSALFFFFDFVQLGMPNTLGNNISGYFNISSDRLGALATYFSMGNFIFIIPAGIIIDRYSTRKILLCSLAASVFGAFGLVLSSTFSIACLFRFISGSAHAFCFLCCTSLVSKWFSSEKRGKVMGVVIYIGLFGLIFANKPLKILNFYLGWKGALMVNVIFGIATLIIAFLIVGDYPLDDQNNTQNKANKTAPILAIKQAVGNIDTWRFALYIALINSPLMVIGIIYLNNFLFDVYKINSDTASAISTLFFLGHVTGCAITGVVAEKWGNSEEPMFFGSFFSLILLLCLLFAPIKNTIFIGSVCILIGGFISTQVLAYPAIMSCNKPEAIGGAMSITSLVVMGSIPGFQSLCRHLMKYVNSSMSRTVIVDGIEKSINSYSLFGWCVIFSPVIFALFGSLIISTYYLNKSSNK